MAEATRILVMGGRTTGYHEFQVMGPIYKDFLEKAGFRVTLSEDRDLFLKERMADFDVVVDYTTGEDLSDAQRDGLLGAIRSGKGFVGVHSAADSFKKTEGYIPMVGGRFLMHPSPRSYVFRVLNPHHPTMADVPDFEMVEELYLMETVGHFELLMSTRFKGIDRPISWAKGYGLGRVFYTALGHGEEQTRNPNFQRIVVNAVRWTASAAD